MVGIQDELAAAETLVLNGDIFDFRWSVLNMEATIAAAMDWLNEHIAQHSGQTIHYLLGNHDCITGFAQELCKFAEKQPLFACHEFFLKLDHNLFLHGDCANRRMDGNELRSFRESWSRHGQSGRIGKVLYDLADSVGASDKVHDWWFPQHDTVLRVSHHLDHIMPAWRNEIGHCYFGHTHRPFSNYSHDGVLFHNTGSAIRKMGFQPLRFCVR